MIDFYLEHGYLSSANCISGRAAFEEQFSKWIHLPIDQLKTTLRKEGTAKRLLSITPSKHLWSLIEKLHGTEDIHDTGKTILQLQAIIAHYAPSIHEQFRYIMMEALLKWVVYDNKEPFPLASIAAHTLHSAGYSSEKIFHEANIEYHQPFTPPMLHQESFSQPQLLHHESICIFNAGLILAVHYLNDFFERTGLKHNKQLIHPGLAVAALQWMATGAEQFAELELVLPKLLCGMEPHQCLPQVREIPAFIKKKAQDLLQCLSNLKNTSVEALRNLFLQRQGRLSWLNDHWFLQVEHDPCAVLPEHFPLTTVKLPVMKEIIYVEW